MWQQDSSQSWVDWQAQENICKGLQHDQVDWAALAQQWISMKDTSTGFVNNVKEPLLPTPPQPPMVRSEDTMEIEEDIENPLIFDVHHKAAPEPWQQWDNRNEQQVWHPNQHWTAPGYSTVHHVPPPAPPQPPGYWTAPGHHFRPHQPQPAPYVPSLLSLNVPPAPAPRNTAKPLAFLKQERQSLLAEPSHKEDDFDAEQEDIPMIDAVKRKQLPAWLREGLEKMEQEKIKKEQIKLQKLQQLENLRKQKEEEDMRKKEAEEKGLVFIPGKSKFESDSESDTEEPQNPVEPFKVKLEREREALKVEPDFHEPIFKTKEEVFQEMLMKVKRIMTEVLLDVTTVEINSVAKEELSRAKKKASNSALVKGQALQSLTGKLGLGLYDNSDSEEGDEEIGVQKENHLESSDDDDKIKCRIQRYKSSFATKELEIERQNRELEQRTAHLERKFLGQESSEEEEESSDEERGNERQVQSNDHGFLDQRAVSEEEQVSIKEEKQERKKVSRWDAKAGKNDSKTIDKSQEQDNLTKNVSPHSVKQEEPSSPREAVRTPVKPEKEHKISRERRRSETERYRSDVERSERYRSDTERSERYRSDAERSERYRSDAERSERHRSDAERSERYLSDAERSKRYRTDAERSKLYHSTRESKKSSVTRERSVSSDEDRRLKKDRSDRKGSRGSHRSDRYSERYSRRSVSRNRKRKRSDSREKRREKSRRIRERSKSRDSGSSTKREQMKNQYGTSVPERDRYGKEDKVSSRSNLKDKNRDKIKIEERKRAKRRRSPSSSSSSSSDSTSYSSSSSSSSEESSSESSSASASSRLKGRK